ncbi:ABC transporter substrate-binding protein [Enterocloster citroniae]|uniref:ABC transporter substrate-binding protein n=1 Tax=Enterocloster citroniae TaxID=358743 RepID=UPI001D082651|nr:ABC transporter substrate-binding protein [Enterocloster citroniae]MCB7065825.1 ABC transporter substrate-binding protein [Enterocloster citroniae]
MKRRFLATLLAGSMIISSLTGCQKTADQTKGDTTSAASKAVKGEDISSPEQAAQEAEYKDELHIGYKIEPATLDTMLISDAPARVVSYGSIYEALVTMDEEFKVREELCESYEVSADAKEYTWKLRKGVKFHNGEEMKADDVVASMNRWVEHYGNAKAMVGDSQFEKVDDYTVKITLDEPAAFLNELIATQTQGSVIMPKSVLDDPDPETGAVKSYVGTGPYKFGEWKEGSYIRLDRFNDYQPYGTEGETSGWYGYKSQLTKTVYFDIVTDVSTRTTGIQTGEFDVVTEMSSDDYQMFQSTEGLQTWKELNGEWVIVYNKASGLTQDVNIRQAVNAIADPTEILTAAHGSSEFFRVEVSFMPEETANWFTDAGKENAHRVDADLAKEYLAKANYNGEPFRILCASNDINLTNAAVALKAELESIGMTVEMVTPDWTSYSTYRSDPSKYDVFFAALMPVAVPSLQLFLSPTWAGFTNDQKIFDMVAQMNQTSSLEDGQKIWDELQTYCWNESLPATKLGSVFLYNVYNEKVDNFVFFCSGPIIGNMAVRK